jgi:membrane peptidoglycan carboxypeptidase
MTKKLRIFLASVILVIIGISTYETIAISAWAKKVAEEMPKDVKNLVKEKKISYVPISEISPFVQSAAIASQDQRFYTNYGIDLVGTIRAIYYSITTSHRQGASTITEQLAKNVYYSDSDSLKTDIQTKILAVFITQLYPKQQILEWYLNVIYYGKNSYGIENASENFFKTKARNLTKQQSAYLIALVNMPGYYSLHPDEAQRRAQLVIISMNRLGF